MSQPSSHKQQNDRFTAMSSGISNPDTLNSVDTLSPYEGYPRRENATFSPLAKDFDSDESLGPPYPQTLNVQSSDKKAFNKDKLSQPCQVHGYELSRCCQGRCSDGRIPTLPDVATTDLTLRRPWTCRAHLSSPFNPTCHRPLLCRYGRK